MENRKDIQKKMGVYPVIDPNYMNTECFNPCVCDLLKIKAGNINFYKNKALWKKL